MEAQRFIMAGGGTGGHIFPAIAIANALKKMMPDAEFLFIGARGKMEMEKVPKAGFQIEGLTIAGFNRSSLIKNIQLPFKLVKSFIQVYRIFKHFKPTAVIGVGGYSSFPVLRFAQSKNIPTFIHESNSFAGKSNILLGKKATQIFTAASGMEKFFPANQITITGNPVRQAISQMNISRTEGVRFFGLKDSLPVILSIGGSLGAKSINESIYKHIDAFGNNNLQLIWQTGKPYATLAKEVSSQKENVYVSDFISEMEYAYAAADVVISRSGAMAIAELCVAKKPAIFVPYPFAAEDHQTANAMNLVELKAAVLVKDYEAMDHLVEKVIRLSGDEKRKAELVENISKLGVTNADEKIARWILNYLKK